MTKTELSKFKTWKKYLWEGFPNHMNTACDTLFQEKWINYNWVNKWNIGILSIFPGCLNLLYSYHSKSDFFLMYHYNEAINSGLIKEMLLTQSLALNKKSQNQIMKYYRLFHNAISRNNFPFVIIIKLKRINLLA